MTGARDAEIDRFLAGAGWADARRANLAQDASFRRYERITRGADAAVLMDAPPEHEDVRPFVRIARKLAELDLSAPRLLAEDSVAGLLLLEDLGDATFTRLLEAGEDAASLYDLAVDVLIDLHRRPRDAVVPDGVPPYDDALLLTEAGLFTDWYLPAHLGAPVPDEAVSEYRKVWADLLPSVRAVPNTLVLRDFHVDNLMRLEGRDGVAACGLLDFQDAVDGPVAYDFVSLVEDARRDVTAAVAMAARARYLAAFPDLHPGSFDLACAILGAQRHCKVLGIFTRLRDRDGKSDYVVHIPRLWRLLERAVTHPALGELKGWLDRYVPPARRVVPPPREAG